MAHQINCDTCNYDITSTGNWEDYRLVLDYQNKDHWSGCLTELAISPPVERTFYFCGIPCLSMWIAKEHPDSKEKYEKLQKHRAWMQAGYPHKGTKEHSAFETEWQCREAGE